VAPRLTELSENHRKAVGWWVDGVATREIARRLGLDHSVVVRYKRLPVVKDALAEAKAVERGDRADKLERLAGKTVDRLLALMEDPETPARSIVDIAKLVLPIAGHVPPSEPRDDTGEEPSVASVEQLQDALRRLQTSTENKYGNLQVRLSSEDSPEPDEYRGVRSPGGEAAAAQTS
jgi:hypothetical protein